VNYLAHIALSGTSPQIIMGNFCGDYVKGKLDSDQKSTYPKDFLTGVRLHRFIDHFTDTDDTVRVMIKEVCQLYGRSASVVTDICFDYFLAKSFSVYHSSDIRFFTTGFYEIYRQHLSLVPERMIPFAEALVSNDWLYKYREWQTVERTLRSMGNRYPFLSDLLSSSEPMKRELDVYEQYFVEFYPRLKKAVAQHLEELTGKSAL
jgi:acyl carrier protein phosphodiesterase